MPEMSIARYTPAPWTTKLSYAKDADGRLDVGIAATLMDRVGTPTVLIAGAFGRVGQDIWLDAEANARLIAAAPDLYEAIKGSMEYLEEQFGDCDEGCKCIMHDLRAAIAKAEGRS